MNSQAAIIINNINKTYANGHHAIKDLNLIINQGDFFALLGPNGAGKSTLIGMICSLVNITSGSIQILNNDLVTKPSTAKRYLGIMPQEINLNIFESGWNILLTQASYYGLTRKQAKHRAEMLLNKVDLWAVRHKTAKTYSGGMKRRLMIARALIHDPKILILDEPTAGVDIEIRQSIWKFLSGENKNGLTIILTTHYLEEAENLCNRIGIINHGKLITNTSMESLLSDIDCETFILYLTKSINTPPTLKDITIQQLDGNTLEVVLKKSQSIQYLTNELQQHDIMIDRIKNKQNRLEQLFSGIITNNQKVGS